MGQQSSGTDAGRGVEFLMRLPCRGNNVLSSRREKLLYVLFFENE